MRLVRRVLYAYLLYALAGRVFEGMGGVRCGCAPDCWCKRPVLSTFRWAFPYGHKGGASPQSKALLEARARDHSS